MRQFLTLGVFIIPITVMAQTPVGRWHCDAYQVQLTLTQEGTYSMQHSGGQSQGYYQINANQVWLKDMNATQAVGYYAAMPDVNHLTLTDINDVSMAFTRLDQPSQVAPARSAMQSGEVLSESGGRTLRQGHVDVGLGLTEFILGYSVTQAERRELTAKLIEEFNTMPGEVLAQLSSLDQSLRKLATLKDPYQIGLARQKLYAALFLASSAMKESEKPLIIQVLNRHIKVLATDPANQLVLTDKDAGGMVKYLSFINRCQGMPGQFSAQQEQAIVTQLARQFPSMSLEQKQVLCCGSLIWKLMETNWNHMNPSQQQQFMASMNQQVPNQLSYSGSNQPGYSTNVPTRKKSMIDMQAEFNAKQNMFQMMQNMNLQSHATSLNIIENMGGSSNYWEVTDKPYWMN